MSLFNAVCFWFDLLEAKSYVSPLYGLMVMQYSQKNIESYVTD